MEAASALFAGLTAILVKCGIRKTDSDAATAIRTGVVLVMAWLIVFVKGKQHTLRSVPKKELVFLILSGLATGGSWLCYFRALQQGDVNKVVPIDKSSTILTILLALILLGEPVSWLKGLAILFIGAGTFLMIEKKSVSGEKREKKSWLIYAVLSAVFASLTSILGKIGINGVESNLGTAIRTIVVLLFSWLMVWIVGSGPTITSLSAKTWIFLILSGLATGGSWLCYCPAGWARQRGGAH